MIPLLKKLFYCSLLLIPTSVYSQKNRTCGAYEASMEMMKIDSNYAKKVASNNRQAILNKNARLAGGPYTIPVVVHVLYNTPNQNISDAQIESQLTVLNQDYNLSNTNFLNSTPPAFQTLAGNTQIKFELAKRDPSGKPTNGITRTATNTIGFTYGKGDKEKYTESGGRDAWNTDKYLNIWVCNLTDALGYAYFPGVSKSVDGLTIAYGCFGTIGTAKSPYHLGRTATHEIGHYLNLMHIWGDKSDCTGNDGVDDTPQHHNANYECHTFPYKVCASTAPNGEMYMNYMDYSPDICMSMFSKGQSNRMENTLLNSRSTLISSDGTKPYLNKNDVGLFNIISPIANENACGNKSITIELTNIGTDTLKNVNVVLMINQQIIYTQQWKGSLLYLQSTNVSFDDIAFTSSNNLITIYTNAPNNVEDNDTKNDTISTEVLKIQNVTLPLLESFESSIFPPSKWVIYNPDNNLTWEKSNTTGYIGTKSLVFKNFNATDLNSQIDQLISPSFKCNKSSLSFYYSYKKYSVTETAFDTLTIMISTDCGITKKELFKKGGNDLTTTSPTFSTQYYTPTLKTDWKKVEVSLSNYENQDVSIYFENETNFENNLYIDSIFISSDTVLEIEESIKNNDLKIYPNPTENILTVDINQGFDIITFYNILGEEVLKKSNITTTITNFNLSNLQKGIYIISIKKENQIFREKILVQ